ncbi:hypothetical protein RHMOL_Rhmol05G0009100 [Rhododendron molle]|uniref:Uncharacterized protein n=1 Tax=Rhododendron molle TaxID=49168 RepID=A0ACC0NJ23_RHOML|nr:hypothetical protein RHMOL_Rhmol05G0009100 [Rhododendron molle]
MKRENASDTAKIINATSWWKSGRPVLPLLPPGTVIAAAKTIVTMSAAGTVHKLAVSFIHFPPSATNSMCFFVNTISGISPS